MNRRDEIASSELSVQFIQKVSNLNKCSMLLSLQTSNIRIRKVERSPVRIALVSQLFILNALFYYTTESET